MSGNLLVINVDIREIRVALIEKGIIAELHIERLSSRSTLGNVCLGTVSRVLPGMQAAFIDIGQERAAFLHVEDLIRPDDFEAYLSGARSRAERELDVDGGDEDDELVVPSAPIQVGGGAPPPAAAEVARAPEDEVEEEGEEPEEESVAPEEDDGIDDDATDESGGVEPACESSEAAPASEDDEPDDEEAEAEETSSEAAPGSDSPASDAGTEEPPPSNPGSGEPSNPGSGEPSNPGSGEPSNPGSGEPSNPGSGEPSNPGSGEPSNPGSGEPSNPGSATPADEPSPTAGRRRTKRTSAEAKRQAEPDETEERARGGGRRRRRARRARVARSSRATSRATSQAPAAKKAERQPERRGGRRRDTGRISKSTPIREVVREGQQVVVQVTKEPIGTKGARVSSHVSLPGRYVVYLPTVDHVGISKRIGSEKERSRLRATIESLKPPKGGIVVRTMGEGLTKKQLKNDIGYLVRLWDEIARKREEVRKAPAILYEELDLVLKTARDLFTEEVDRIVIDNREQYARLRRFVQMFMPERVDDIELYEGREPLFDAYGIEDEIGRALARKVPLASGGYLIIDQAEALTAIDVNTGRYVGKGQKDLEDTILQTNLEAVQEIAYQLRFRNIGGLIILDLIDMEKPSNREKVRRRLMELLAKDKAKTTFNRISDLGLIEMTRKRTRESLGRLLHEPCFYCDGTGQLMSKETIAYEILRQIRREQAHLKGWHITVNAHPAIVDLLKSDEREAVAEAERMFARRIELVPKKEYHIEQFDLQGA